MLVWAWMGSALESTNSEPWKRSRSLGVAIRASRNVRGFSVGFCCFSNYGGSEKGLGLPNTKAINVYAFNKRDIRPTTTTPRSLIAIIALDGGLRLFLIWYKIYVFGVGYSHSLVYRLVLQIWKFTTIGEKKGWRNRKPEEARHGTPRNPFTGCNFWKEPASNATKNALPRDEIRLRVGISTKVRQALAVAGITKDETETTPLLFQYSLTRDTLKRQITS